MNIGTGIGISIGPNGGGNNGGNYGDHMLSLAQEVEDSGAKPRVASRELGRLHREGGAPAMTTGGPSDGNIKVLAMKATRWTRPASNESGTGTLPRRY